MRRAHPRSRGENGAVSATIHLRQGSSPLTRGKREHRGDDVPHGGLIPAHAGKTTPQTNSLTPCGAHPRSRGENQIDSSAGNRELGSSPLTRGKRRDRQVQEHAVRLIPAHAGKTLEVEGQQGAARAHPRSRGENIVRPVCRRSWNGSSPLTRGKQDKGSTRGEGAGLIPAHAGKTRARRARSWASRAHPRSRGENCGESWPAQAELGSSPLTRGKPRGGARGSSGGGLIPAHAGKTQCRRLRRRGDQAHPRSRGENVGALVQASGGEGSSPLTRGKQNEHAARQDLRGLIPAHAGKTHENFVPVVGHQAHPRSRGENAPRSAASLTRCGSSPLTRGKPVLTVLVNFIGGLIPAHAGKTTG